MKAINTEGLEFINHEVLEKQRNILSFMVKKMGTNLLSGKSIMNVSLPIGLFDSRSQLEVIAYNTRFANHFMQNVANTSNLERLKLIMGYMVATMPLGLTGSKPFNPIIGETFQAKIGDSLLYFEQTSHHPPIFNFYMKCKDYIVYGHHGIDITSSANSIKGEAKSKIFWKTNDGNVYQFHLPCFQMTGLMMGNRYMNFTGALAVEDKTNELIAVVNFNPEEGKTSFFGKMFKSKPKRFPDYYNGFIARTADVKLNKKGHYEFTTKEDVAFAKFEGEWSYDFNVDGVCYYKQGEVDLQSMERQEFTLPSDCTYREDLVLLKAGYDDYAQLAKMKMEEIQRNDKKLREKNRK
jgi:hypothetical protein